MTEKQAAELQYIDKEINAVEKEIISLSRYKRATGQLLTLLDTLKDEENAIYIAANHVEAIESAGTQNG